jgi:hypothetical protein
MKAIQPTAIINPSDPQKIRKFRDRGATQIRDSRIRPASPRWLRHHHAAEARDMPISHCDSSGTPKRRRSGGDDLAKMPSIRRPCARAARGGPSSPARALLTPFSWPATQRVKKSLPDRGGCSMINNLPKLMGESAARGVFRTKILSCFRLLTVTWNAGISYL